MHCQGRSSWLKQWPALIKPDPLLLADRWLLDRLIQPIADCADMWLSPFDVGVLVLLAGIATTALVDVILLASSLIDCGQGQLVGYSCLCGILFYGYIFRHRRWVIRGTINPLRIAYRHVRPTSALLLAGVIFGSTASEADRSFVHGLICIPLLSLSLSLYLVSCRYGPLDGHSEPSAWENDGH